jgi:hypothetical protein
VALPIGTRVTVTSVDHLVSRKPPRHLIGRSAVVADHENGMNIVTGLTSTELVVGHYVFADSDLHITGAGRAPVMPPFYRVRAYRLANGGAR